MIFIILNNRSLYDIAEDACDSSKVKRKMCAIIYNGNSIVSIGINRHYTLSSKHRSIFGLPYTSFHAEVDAITKALRQEDSLRKMSIYIHRKGGKMAKPCHNCMSLLYHFGIYDISWSGKE